MFRISILGVALAALTLAGCRTASSQRQAYYAARPAVVQAVPPAAPCPNGQVPPPPAFIR